MPASKMKLRVPVATLIEAAEATRAKIIENHEQAVAEYEQDRESWQYVVVHVLECNEYELRIPINGDEPSQPSKKPNTSQVDKDLALLRATSDEVLSIGADDDFGRYL